MKILKLDKITDEKWLNLFAATYEHNGHSGRWVYASRKPSGVPNSKPDAVVIVPILHAEGQPPRLVMIKEFRVPVGGYDYAFPAGLLEEGEAIEEAVRREMLEETAMEVVRIRKISPPLLASAGLTDEAAVLAYVDVHATAETKQKLEESEDIEVILLDYEQVCRLCDQPDLPLDARAWSALFMFQQLGKLA